MNTVMSQCTQTVTMTHYVTFRVKGHFYSFSSLITLNLGLVFMCNQTINCILYSSKRIIQTLSVHVQELKFGNIYSSSSMAHGAFSGHGLPYLNYTVIGVTCLLITDQYLNV